MLAEMARRHPQLHMQTCYSDRFVDLITEGYDCAIRVGYLQDSNLIARRIGPIYTKLVASPDYIKAHGVTGVAGRTAPPIRRSCKAPKPGNSWMADKTITVRPQGRFKADNGTALAAAAAAGLGDRLLARLPHPPTHRPRVHSCRS
jgi:DNA-binding transcriptional LysR family regulator